MPPNLSGGTPEPDSPEKQTAAGEEVWEVIERVEAEAG